MPGVILASNPRLDGVPDVAIDGSGRFKYILCKVYINENAAEFKHVVRGMARAEFHAGIFDELSGQLEENGLTCECLGGGKIEHNPQQKTIVVFGLSQGFGRADHSQSVDILKRRYPDYAITWRDD